MIVAMSRDVRVLLIKLADRLHNAGPGRRPPPPPSGRKETLEIMRALAHRLGLNTMKWELEDRSFQVLYPKVYEEIVSSWRSTRRRASSTSARSPPRSRRTSRRRGSRPRSPVDPSTTSIYQKMIVRGRDFSDIYDLVGVRVLVDTVRDCYGARHAARPLVAGAGPLQGLHPVLEVQPLPVLHTTVIGPTGKPVEIQIRTREMHRRAEYGVAAHWKYKAMAGGQGGAEPAAISNDAAWLRQLMDWQKETTDSGEFLDSLRFEINTQEVYVFTPKGDVLALPQGSTPVDFAYSVHTEVGHRTIGARVNGRLVSLESTLSTGDVVEVFTSKSADAGPSRDWLGFVKSPRARSKIRQWFSKERREEALERGKEELAKALRRQDLPMRRLLTHDTLATIATELNLSSIDGLYTSIGEGHTGAQHVVEKLRASFGGSDGAEEDLAEITLPSRARRRGSRQERHTSETDQGVIIDGHADLWVKLAKCCAPVPGPGFITRSSGISVHHTTARTRSSCRSSSPIGWSRPPGPSF